MEGCPSIGSKMLWRWYFFFWRLDDGFAFILWVANLLDFIEYVEGEIWWQKKLAQMKRLFFFSFYTLDL
jgi:hypothetical protein